MERKITEFDLGILFSAVRNLQHRYQDGTDHRSVDEGAYGLDPKSFASELMFYVEEFYRVRTTGGSSV